MEELQSTEKLDREIIEDAKKKALRIRKDCESAAAAQNAKWESKTRDYLDEIDKKYKQLEKDEEEMVMARLPVDKLRAKNEKIEKLLQAAEDTWYKELKRGRVLELLGNELSNRIKYCSDMEKNTQKTAFYSGLTSEEALLLLNNEKITCKIEEIPPVSPYPAIILDTDDVRITASIQKIIDFHLHVKRTELIEALIGGSFMENI